MSIKCIDSLLNKYLRQKIESEIDEKKKIAMPLDANARIMKKRNSI